MELDRTDLKILSELQKDSNRSVGEIAEAVNLSINPVWRRIKRLESEGAIIRRVALLDKAKLGFGMTAFVNVKAASHTEGWLNAFSEAIDHIPNIVEFYRLSGEYDYLLKIVVSDISEFDRVYKQLIRSAQLRDVTSSFAMEVLKHTTSLPLLAF